jgi:uncharacterized protein YbaP (TraB family)
MRGAGFPSSASTQSTTGSRSFLKYLFTLFCALLFTSCAPLAATATTAGVAAQAKSPVEVKYTKGLLWKIEAPGTTTSYLFGTIHSEDKRVTALPGPVIKALDASNRFTMEAIIDGDGLVHMAEAMYFNDGRTLEQVIGKKLYDESIKALAARGIPTHGVEKQKPWAVMMALSMPPPKTGEYLDFILQDRATRQNKPVSGLETIQEQVAVFDELPLPDQIALLKEAVQEQNTFEKDLEEMIEAYLARDIAALAEASEKHKPDNDRLYRSVMERLLTRRNTRMAERMGPILRDGGAFIAVGAAHLPGESGLLNLLAKAGYRVTPVY